MPIAHSPPRLYFGLFEEDVGEIWLRIIQRVRDRLPPKWERYCLRPFDMNRLATRFEMCWQDRAGDGTQEGITAVTFLKFVIAKIREEGVFSDMVERELLVAVDDEHLCRQPYGADTPLWRCSREQFGNSASSPYAISNRKCANAHAHAKIRDLESQMRQCACKCNNMRECLCACECANAQKAQMRIRMQMRNCMCAYI